MPTGKVQLKASPPTTIRITIARVIEEAIRTYLDQQAWLADEIRFGADIPATEPTIDHETLLKVVETLVSGP